MSWVLKFWIVIRQVRVKRNFWKYTVKSSFSSELPCIYVSIYKEVEVGYKSMSTVFFLYCTNSKATFSLISICPILLYVCADSWTTTHTSLIILLLQIIFFFFLSPLVHHKWPLQGKINLEFQKNLSIINRRVNIRGFIRRLVVEKIPKKNNLGGGVFGAGGIYGGHRGKNKWNTLTWLTPTAAPTYVPRKEYSMHTWVLLLGTRHTHLQHLYQQQPAAQGDIHTANHICPSALLLPSCQNSSSSSGVFLPICLCDKSIPYIYDKYPLAEYFHEGAASNQRGLALN